MNLTKNEKKILKAIITKPSNFNFDELDFTKSFSEQRLESRDEFQTFYEHDDYGCGLSKRSAAGVIASLNKKKFIKSFIEPRDWREGPNLNWLMIEEENFNNIKEHLDEILNEGEE